MEYLSVLCSVPCEYVCMHWGILSDAVRELWAWYSNVQSSCSSELLTIEPSSWEFSSVFHTVIYA